MSDPASTASDAAKLRAAFGALKKQQARIEELEHERREPIAVVGLGCRFPGGVDGPQSFWQLLARGGDAIGEIPADRFAVDKFFDPDPEAPGKFYCRQGGFLGRVDTFDARFFGISPREAWSMDPQQRLLLEVAWEALEDAGLPPARLAGSLTGVFVGITVNDYAAIVRAASPDTLDPYFATGNVLNIAAGRLSYFFNFRGPSVALDTACSSSLVAIHQACQSLRARESHVALAGGVNLILGPEGTIAVSKARMLAPDGRCKTFDAAADGYARGEGCGIVVLKRLSDAQRDGDRVHAIIRGSAVMQDGARGGLTVPNGSAQRELIARALENAGVAPAEVGYLEAHGTGTSLGDPIEVEAAGAVLGRGRAKDRPLVIASLKTNFGHLESAAGVAGFIKTVLSLRRGAIPAHLHLITPNPAISFAEIPAIVPSALTPWPANYARRLAGISSFGSSGTIAHIVLEAADRAGETAARSDAPLVISARTPAALDELVGRYAEFLQANPAVDLGAVVRGAALGRTHFEARVALPATDAAGCIAALRAFVAGTVPAHAAGSIAARYVAGEAIDWTKVFPPAPTPDLDLPHYPFQRERFWADPVPVAVSVGDVTPSSRLSDRGEGAAAPKTAASSPQFGVMFFNGNEAPDPRDNYELLIAAARFADANGFSSVWLPERHFTAFGGLYPNPATLHAALARETKHVRLMGGSVVLPLHHPLRIAEEWAVVDNLSGGRAGMSFAPGWNPDDFALAPTAYADRVERLFRGVEEVRRLWRGETLTLPNGAGANVPVRARPAPLQRELPLWITAAGNPRTFERAGEIGANLLTHLLDQEVDELAAKIARYRAARASHGHDPAAGKVTLMLHAFLGDDADTVREQVRGPYCRYLKENIHLLKGLAHSRGRGFDLEAMSAEDLNVFVNFVYERFFATRALLGTPESCRALVEKVAAAGVSEVACLLDFGLPAADVRASLPQLARLRESFAVVSAPVAAGPVEKIRVLSSAPAEVSLEHAFHQIEWRPVTLGAKASAEASRVCVIFADEGGIGEALARCFETAGRPCLRVRRGDAWEPVLAANVGATMVYLWHLDAGAELDFSVVVALFRTLAKTGVRSFAWLVTRGAQALGEIAPAPEQAALWGLARVLPVELPRAWGGLIDLEPSADATTPAEQIAAAIQQAGHEDQIAFRGGQALAARLVRVAAPASIASGCERERVDSDKNPLAHARSHDTSPLQLRADAAYLVTGGLGGLGLAAAGWLADRGARHVILAGRTPLSSDPNDARVRAVRALEARGLVVHLATLDIADAAQVQKFFTDWRVANRPPVRGVWHAAGAWQDRPFVELDAAALETVLRPKVGGVRALEAAFAGQPLDFFVMFSAFSALLPAATQANYAAANAYLDAVALRRRTRGEHALTVNWGPWSEVGFAATEYGRRAHARLESLGIARFGPARGFAALQRLLETDATQAAIMPVDWKRLFQADPEAGLSPLLSELAAEFAVAAVASDAAVGTWRAILEKLKGPAQLERVTLALVEFTATALRIPPAEVDAVTPLNAAGVDSLMAVEIKNRIQAEMGVNVPLVKLIEGGSLASLAEFTLAHLRLAGMHTAGGAAKAGGTPTEEFVL